MPALPLDRQLAIAAQIERDLAQRRGSGDRLPTAQFFENPSAVLRFNLETGGADQKADFRSLEIVDRAARPIPFFMAFTGTPRKSQFKPIP